MKTIKLKFRPSRPNSKSSVVIVKSYIKNETLSLSTGVSINPKDWDNNNMIVRNNVKNSFLLNSELRKFKSELEIIIENLTLKNRLTVSNIKREIRNEKPATGTYDPQLYDKLLEHGYFNYKPGISDKTKECYMSTYKILKKFNEYNDEKPYDLVTLDSINTESFYNEFISFMNEELKFSLSTQDKNIKQIITLMNYAEKRGLLNGIDFRFFKRIKLVQRKSVYLNNEELKLIKEYDFKDKELNSVRDWFIIESFTGLRIGDLFNLKKECFDFDKNIITTTVEKGDLSIITLPIHPWILDVISSNDGELPNTLTNDKYNKSLKTICKNVGFVQSVYSTYNGKLGFYPKYQLVSSHTGRRNFITNLYRDDFDLVEIKELSSHSTEQMVRRYLQVDNEKVIQKVGDHWKRKFN